jgi:hypothetical protein
MQVTERTSFFLEAETDGNGHARNGSPWRGRCKGRPRLVLLDHLGVSDMLVKQQLGLKASPLLESVRTWQGEWIRVNHTRRYHVQRSVASVSNGAGFSVDVDVSDVSELTAFQFDIGFNPAVLSATAVTESSFLPSGGSTFFIPGTLGASWSNPW